MPLTITLPPVKLFTERVRAWTGAIQTAAAGALQEEHEFVITAAKRLVPVDMGTLRGSGVVLPTTLQGTKLVSLGGFGGPAAKYAIVVHEGRRPGSRMPPVSAIRAWARRKGVDEDAAYPIARAIGQRGTRPIKYYETPLLNAARGMGPRLQRRIQSRMR